MKIPPEIATDLRHGAIYHCEGERIGLRKVVVVWFSFASGHFVAKTATGVNMWSDGPDGPWHCAPTRAAIQ